MGVGQTDLGRYQSQSGRTGSAMAIAPWRAGPPLVALGGLSVLCGDTVKQAVDHR